MPTTQIEFDDRNKSVKRVFYVRHREECFGVCHEAISHQPSRCHLAGMTDFVILSSIDRGSRMKVGRVIRLRSAPGRNCAMM